MEIILDALIFDYVDILQGKWPNTTTYDSLQRFALQTERFFFSKVSGFIRLTAILDAILISLKCRKAARYHQSDS